MPVAAHKIDWRHLKAISHGHFPAPIMEGIPSVFTRISIHALRHSARHRSWVSREAPRDSWPSWRSGGQDGFCIGIPSGTSRFQHVILQWRISPGIGTLDPNYFEMLVSMQDIWLYLHFRPVNWLPFAHRQTPGQSFHSVRLLREGPGNGSARRSAKGVRRTAQRRGTNSWDVCWTEFITRLYIDEPGINRVADSSRYLDIWKGGAWNPGILSKGLVLMLVPAMVKWPIHWHKCAGSSTIEQACFGIYLSLCDFIVWDLVLSKNHPRCSLHSLLLFSLQVFEILQEFLC